LMIIRAGLTPLPPLIHEHAITRDISELWVTLMDARRMVTLGARRIHEKVLAF